MRREELPRGPYQGAEIIGETTEAIQGWLKEGWSGDRPPPRIVEDLEFEPKDREEVIYIYMYRVARNSALLNSKHWRESKVVLGEEKSLEARRFWERPPLYLDYYYMLAAHSKFRSDAERLLGWVLLRLNEATHLVYRPRRYILPTGEEVNSAGDPWREDDVDGVVMEKVSVDIVDDLTIGDAVNFFNIHDAPFRPYVTYRARCAMEGSLMEGAPTIVRPQSPVPVEQERPAHAARTNGRMPTSNRARLPRPARRAPIGPEGTEPKRIDENIQED